jgi:hypothetical protein
MPISPKERLEQQRYLVGPAFEAACQMVDKRLVESPNKETWFNATEVSPVVANMLFEAYSQVGWSVTRHADCDGSFLIFTE